MSSTQVWAGTCVRGKEISLFSPLIGRWDKFSLVISDLRLCSVSKLGRDRTEIICWPQLLSGVQSFNSGKILFVQKRGRSGPCSPTRKIKGKVLCRKIIILWGVEKYLWKNSSYQRVCYYCVRLFFSSASLYLDLEIKRKRQTSLLWIRRTFSRNYYFLW